MTAAELASFRTLLQAQAYPPPRPDRGLFARMRARLTVVERTEAPANFTPRSAPQPAPWLACSASWAEDTLVPVADPPPVGPRIFGRRETGPEPEPAPPAAAPIVAEAPGPERVAVRLRTVEAIEEPHGTPDDLETDRPASPSAPGTIAGWSRARPPRAQQRILQRLEAVFTAERQGLDARIAADAR